MLLKDLLKQDRRNRGMTQEEYSKELKLTRGTLSHLERGREPSAENLRKISEYFDKPIAEILGDETVKKLSELETTNLLIDSLIEKGQITKDNILNDEVKKIILATLELEIKLKLDIRKH